MPRPSEVEFQSQVCSSLGKGGICALVLNSGIIKDPGETVLDALALIQVGIKVTSEKDFTFNYCHCHLH